MESADGILMHHARGGLVAPLTLVHFAALGSPDGSQ